MVLKKSKKSLVFVVACALINTQGEVLIAQRVAGKSFSGLWEFPGGKVELGETPEEALVREMQEELNIIIKAEDLRPFNFVSHAYEDFHLFMPLYLCYNYKGDISGLEGQKYLFVAPYMLEDYPWVPADVALVNSLKAVLMEKR